MSPSARKFVGSLALLAYLFAYIVLAVTVAGLILPQAPSWAGLLFYAAAGIIWVFPLKPLFGWMNGAPRQ